MKRRLKKKWSIVLIGMAIILASFSVYSLYCHVTDHENILFTLFESREDKLKKIGYAKEEIDAILSLTNENVVEILHHPYEKKIPLYIQEKNFQEKNLWLYVEEQANLQIADTIFLVNHPDYAKGTLYTEEMVKIMQEKYYLSKNKERYFDYQKEHQTLSSSLIISLVNANRDYEEYTHTTKTKLSTTALVNKYTYLDKEDNPTDLVTQSTKYGAPSVRLSKVAYTAFIKMFEDAKKEGLTLYVNSAYRSYTSQKQVYEEYVQTHGKEASKYAALPGYSEHQTGLALDIFKPGTTTKTFASTKEATWMRENAYQYGFILRYPKGKENITGYAYEAWHYRYVGVEIATKMYQENLTLEEYIAYYESK